MHISVCSLCLFLESRNMLRKLGDVAIGDLVQFWVIMGLKHHLQYHFHRKGSLLFSWK